jgi:hypothetical protein
MIDDWIDAFPNHWPITYSADTLEDALSVGYFDSNPNLEPRSTLRPELCVSTTLIYERTGMPYNGAVYLMRS